MRIGCNMVKYSKSAKRAYWALFSFFMTLVIAILLIIGFSLPKYYLLPAVVVVIVLGAYFFNIGMTRYYCIFEDCIVYYCHEKEKLRIAYNMIDHAELIKRRERSAEYEQLRIFYDNKKKTILISNYDNVEELLDALCKRGIRVDLPAEYISGRYIDYMRAKEVPDDNSSNIMER